MKNGDHLFLVDGSGYIFRAYHALPPLMRKSDGLPVGRRLGLLQHAVEAAADARNTDVGVVPTHFAVIFDYSSKYLPQRALCRIQGQSLGPAGRSDPAVRPDPRGDPRLQSALPRDRGLRGRRPHRHLCRLASEAGGDVTIVSSDKDLMQLVGPRVSMYDPMKDRQIGVPEVVEKWGVTPDKMIDLQALTGDSVDNVPGVPGIGPKTAAQLLEPIRRP